MEHFNGILFHKSGPANKQHTNHSSLNAKQFLFTASSKQAVVCKRFHVYEVTFQYMIVSVVLTNETGCAVNSSVTLELNLREVGVEWIHTIHSFPG